MAKIKFEKWKKGLQFQECSTGFKIDGIKWWKTSSEHGRSQGTVKCPCCDALTDIYIWSFRGSGKRCSNCNVMLGSMSAYVDVKEVVFYECKSCHNEWTALEGFRIDTGQCAGCQKWDDDKPKRDKEWEERKQWLADNRHCVDIPYVAGDPHW